MSHWRALPACLNCMLAQRHRYHVMLNEHTKGLLPIYIYIWGRLKNQLYLDETNLSGVKLTLCYVLITVVDNLQRSRCAEAFRRFSPDHGKVSQTSCHSFVNFTAEPLNVDLIHYQSNIFSRTDEDAMKRLTSPSTFSRFASLNSSIQKTPCATCSLRRMLHSYRAQRQPQTTHSIAINREHSRRVDARLHHGLNPRSSRIPLRARLQNLQPRRTTTTSTTAVRASAHARTSVDVPPWLRGVHAALKRLERDAATYVPVSQLHLALQGLEVPSAPIRIAGMLSGWAQGWSSSVERS